AVDLARSAGGRWWAISDRAQAPSGAGYALENRTGISRAFPEQFRDLKVRRLNTFFRPLQQSLRHWAPSSAGEGGTPRIV
ncbi:circularly permuted type 2 ATP-grasp protein, partial [Proteus faecis]|uniref:circularly permuted type 2 ATP-grasp protein n=1 Tax=Proteus faecis TaxID=2050967 RepID=UPI00301D4F9E